MGITEKSIGRISGLASPKFLARERYVELDGFWTEIFPLGRVQLGSVVLFEGALNSGVTSAVFEFLSAGGMRRRWIALVGFENLGFLAAFERGVDLGKVVSVPDPGRSLGQVVAVLIEAFPVVVIANPRFISFSQARNLVSRIRMNNSIMVVVQRDLYGVAGQIPAVGDSDNIAGPFEHGRSIGSGIANGDVGIDSRCVSAQGKERAAPLIVQRDPFLLRPGKGASNTRDRGFWPGSYDYLVKSSMAGFSGVDQGSGFIRECSLSLSVGSKRDGDRTKSVTILI